MPPVIAALVLGAILIVSGITNRNVVDVALGRDERLSDSTADEALKKFGVTTADLGTLPGLSSTPQDGTGSGLSRLTAECNRIDALNLTYVWGGGHAGYPHNGPFDCSGAVSYVLHAAGLLKGPPRVSGLLMAYGQAGPGQHVTVYANTGHVFLIIDGRCWGTSRHNPGGGPGWFPMPDAAYLASFTQRHPPGL